MPEPLRIEVCKLLELSVVPGHTVLYRKGDDAMRFYLLLDGAVSLWREPPHGSPPATPRGAGCHR
jgi:CRP-like cAMP-binding protein